MYAFLNFCLPSREQKLGSFVVGIKEALKSLCWCLMIIFCHEKIETVIDLHRVFLPQLSVRFKLGPGWHWCCFWCFACPETKLYTSNHYPVVRSNALEAAVGFAIVDGISPLDEVYFEFALIHIRKICQEFSPPLLKSGVTDFRLLALFPGVSLLRVDHFYLLGPDGRKSTRQLGLKL